MRLTIPRGCHTVSMPLLTPSDPCSDGSATFAGDEHPPSGTTRLPDELALSSGVTGADADQASRSGDPERARFLFANWSIHRISSAKARASASEGDRSAGPYDLREARLPFARAGSTRQETQESAERVGGDEHPSGIRRDLSPGRRNALAELAPLIRGEVEDQGLSWQRLLEETPQVPGDRGLGSRTLLHGLSSVSSLGCGWPTSSHADRLDPLAMSQRPPTTRVVTR